MMLLIWDDNAGFDHWVVDLGLSNWDVSCDWCWWGIDNWWSGNRWTLAGSDNSVAKIIMEWDDLSCRSFVGKNGVLSNESLAIWELNPLSSNSRFNLSSRSSSCLGERVELALVLIDEFDSADSEKSGNDN